MIFTDTPLVSIACTAAIQIEDQHITRRILKQLGLALENRQFLPVHKYDIGLEPQSAPNAFAVLESLLERWENNKKSQRH
jgi:hypothetical protein